MNEVSVLFFATLKELVGVREIRLDLPAGASVSQLKSILENRYPRLTPALKTTLVSVNREYAADEELIPQGAEVALFPPVSGGNQPDQRVNSPDESQARQPTIIMVTEDELNLNELLRRITLPTTGAACLFTGMVRAVTQRDDPHETVYLEYEAYQPMAEAKMRQVADEIRNRWPAVEGIVIVQRIGHLDPGTPTVLIACSAGHRDTGVFEAARYGIDRLKEIVPVWKKEVSPSGETWVEGEYIPGARE